jgi:FkbH-like protein
LTRFQNAYMLDVDGISATFGRKYIQDDTLWSFNHGSVLTDLDFAEDQQRLHPPRPASEHYTLRPCEYVNAIWEEIVAIFRTVRQFDSVKLVIVDLDDTLWRGVVAEERHISWMTTEGWPLGFAEALLYLKHRGILLAIVSKNSEEKIVATWPHIWNGRLKLEDFAFRAINWKSKAENVHDALAAINVLPASVVFVDDNPVERATVAQAFPGLRTLGSDLYYTRRILLYSPETQVPNITAESARRTDMIQAQVVRESERTRMSRADFLASLNVKVEFSAISTADHQKFLRAFELINKTNQFNTTGRRWTREQLVSAMAEGTVLCTFEVQDKYTSYGLVGVAVLNGCHIEQFAMSCRVIGLEVETHALTEIEQRLAHAGHNSVTAEFKPTESNSLCAELFALHGYRKDTTLWTKAILRLREHSEGGTAAA